MRKEFLAPIAALSVISAAVAICAPTQVTAQAIGYKFLPENLTPVEIGDLVKKSLARKEDGTFPLLDGECTHNPDACAEPIHYLTMFQQADPKADLRSVDQLPEYLSDLVEVPAPEGEYTMACIEQGPDGYVAVFSCGHRAFKPGEKAYARRVVDVNGKLHYIIVLAGNCKNPVGARFDVVIQVNCLIIDYDVPPGTVKVVGEYGGAQPLPVPLPSTCKLAVKQPGDQGFMEVNTGCVNAACFAGPEGDAANRGRIITASSRMTFEYGDVRPGPQRLRLPYFVKKDGNTVIICIEVRDSEGRIHTWKHDYMDFHPTDGGHEFHMRPFEPAD